MCVHERNEVTGKPKWIASSNLPAGGKLSKGNEKIYEREKETNRVIASHACFLVASDIG